MSASTAPPRLPLLRWRGLAPGELDHERLWLAVSTGVAVLGAFWMHAGLPHPPCAFKALTGCPCLTCGATRAVRRLAEGDWLGACLYNPLVMAALAAVALYNLYALGVFAGALPRLRPVRAASRRRFRFIQATAILVIAANWSWVIHRGN